MIFSHSPAFALLFCSERWPLFLISPVRIFVLDGLIGLHHCPVKSSLSELPLEIKIRLNAVANTGFAIADPVYTKANRKRTQNTEVAGRYFIILDLLTGGMQIKQKLFLTADAMSLSAADKGGAFGRSASPQRIESMGVFWCGRGDSNPHALRRHPLKMVRLPVPPLPHEER